MNNEIENKIKQLEKRFAGKLLDLTHTRKQYENYLITLDKNINELNDELVRVRPEHEAVLAKYPDVVLLSNGDFQSKSVISDFDGLKFSDKRSTNLFVSPYKNVTVNDRDVRVYATPTRSSLIKYVWSWNTASRKCEYQFTNFFTKTKFTEDVLRASRKEIVNFIDYKTNMDKNVIFNFEKLDERVKKILNFM